MTTPKAQFGGLFLVKAGKSAPLTTKVTASTGYTDLSDAILAFDPVVTAEIRRLGHRAGRPIQLAAAERLTGTVTISVVRFDGATTDPHKFFNDLMWQSQANSNLIGRFQFVYNPTRPASGNVPVATTSNPQHSGSAVISELTPWESHQGLLILTINAELDEDYEVYTA